MKQYDPARPLRDFSISPAAVYLQELMRRYITANLTKDFTPEQFQKYIQSLPGQRDPAVYTDVHSQRDFSVQFEWGHDHDFGTFYMIGQMGKRHIHIPAAFIELYNFPTDLQDKTILDVGCWTGGTSLLLAAMGADVTAIEEVGMYAHTVSYLRRAFKVSNLRVEYRSLYSIASWEFRDYFDYVAYFGVLYHVSDPLLSLRIIFNSLKDGGQCLLETAIAQGPGNFCEYWGARDTLDRPRVEGCPRTGWKWFVPTIGALTRMAEDIGFVVEKVTRHNNRALALLTREQHVDMLRAGLSQEVR